MKTKLFLFALPLMFLYGCTKDESNIVSTVTDHQKIENSSTIMRINLLNPNYSFESFSAEALQSGNYNQVNARSSENHSANGHFSPAEGWVCTFSGMENNTGMHGSCLMSGPAFSVHMESYCLLVDGNVAVYEGVITQVLYQDENFCGNCLAPGWHIAFEVKDNGEGQNAPPDQIGTYIWWWDQPLCQDLTPGSEENWGEFLDVLGQGNQIQVK